MDGPNTNLKLLSEVQNECQKNKPSSLIDIGSCNLHLIHWAFKTGSEKSSWDLHKILKGAVTWFPCKKKRLLQPNWFWRVPPSVLWNKMSRKQKISRKDGKQEQYHTEVTSITNYKVHHQIDMNNVYSNVTYKQHLQPCYKQIHLFILLHKEQYNQLK